MNSPHKRLAVSIYHAIPESLKTPRIEMGLRRWYRRTLLSLDEQSLYSVREKQLMSILNETFRSSDVFYDIGAGWGLYSFLLGRHHDLQSIHAFEPHPLYYNELSYWLQQVDRACAHQFVLSDTDGTTEFPLKTPSESTGTFSLADATSGETIKVEKRQGDNLGLTKPDIVKIDVEGAELRVLKGFEQILNHEPPRLIVCEVHEEAPDESPTIYDFGDTPKELHAFLEMKGYTIEILTEGERDYHLKATKL